jgi:hypothetical protein
VSTKKLLFNPKLLCLLIIMTGLPAVPAFAKEVEVTISGDTKKNDPTDFGTLRDAIRHRADPGDIILIKVRKPIELLDDLTIPSRLVGLTIRGPATIKTTKGFRSVVHVDADNVTIQDITFRDVSLLIQKILGGSSVPIIGSTIQRNNFRGDSQAFLLNVKNCRFEHNNFNVSPGPATGNTALNTSRTDNCTIFKNWINTKSSIAFHENSSKNVHVIENTVIRGKTLIDSISGEILGNKIRSLEGITVDQSDFSASNSFLLVQENKAKRIYIERTNIHVIKNILEGPAEFEGELRSLIFLENGDPRADRLGPVLVQGNNLTGGNNGITYIETPSAQPTEILDNEIRGCENAGIIINRGRDVRAANNDIQNCGIGTIGKGIGIGVAQGNAVVIEDNPISHIAGVGIEVAPQVEGRIVTLRNNHISENDAVGITLLDNSAGLAGYTLMDGNNVHDNGGPAGIVAEFRSNGRVHGGEINNNDGAGVAALAEATIEISQVRMTNNTGPGIDISPTGVTANTEQKLGNGDLDWPENLQINPQTLKLEGTAVANGVVEVFIIETGARTGNRENGEGETFLGSAPVNANGQFVFPVNGTIICPASRLITLTATSPGSRPVTSEFSTDFDCVLPDPGMTDTDGDGVLNGVDACPNTPANEPVDANGCSESQKDDDGDGVANNVDTCPATPTEEIADGTGCSESQIDDDNDGVVNSLDLCPNTPAGEAVDANGCSESQKDDDGDGVANNVDTCPATPTEEIADGTGCSESQLDDDMDTVVNSLDKCMATDGDMPVDENGCEETVFITDFGTVYCNDIFNCLFDPTSGVGSCADCGAEVEKDIGGFLSSVEINAFGSIDGGSNILSILSDGSVSCRNCNYVSAPFVDIDASYADLILDADNNLICDGGPDSCWTEFADGGVSSCSDDTSCRETIFPILWSTAVPRAEITIEKTTLGGDGVFDFAVSLRLGEGEQIISSIGEITTIEGEGSSVVKVFAPIVDLFSEVSVAELIPLGFTFAALDCGRATTSVSLVVGGEDFSDGGSFLISGNESATCIFTNLKNAIATVTPLPDGHIGPEGITNSHTFGLPPGNRVAIATGEGLVIVDALTGEVPVAGSTRLSIFDSFANINALVLEDPANPGADAILAFGPSVASTRKFNPATGIFGLAQVNFFSGITDEVHVGGDVGVSETVIADNGFNGILMSTIPTEGDFAGFVTGQIVINRFVFEATATGNVFTAFAYSLGNLACHNPCEGGPAMPLGQCSAEIDAVINAVPSCGDTFWDSLTCGNVYNTQNDNFCDLPADQRLVNFGGQVIVVTDGVPGEIYLAEPAFSQGPITFIGNAGNDPRRVRCLSGICAISNFSSDSLTIVQWDGSPGATVASTVDVGDGPVGIDLKEVGGNLSVISTGFNDNTYTVSVIAPDGSVVSNDTSPVPDGCVNPGHAIWLNNTDQAVVTCNGSDNYAVFSP